MSKKSIRAAQLVAPFGPGAIVELGSESFTCTDISQWPTGDCPPLRDNPLERVLGKVIRRPPIEESVAELPFFRFPKWVFCPTCRRLYDYRSVLDKSNDFQSPVCENARCNKSNLVPMRFIAVCDQGHLQDVDWFSWAHRNSQVTQTGQCTRQTARLEFHTTGASGGDFNAMSIRCSCTASNTFEGLTNRPYPFKCHGRQPWEQYKESTCASQPRVFPRAASNVYYAQTRSALDIEPDGTDGAATQSALSVWLNGHQPLMSFRGTVPFIPDWISRGALYKHLIDEAVRQFGLNEEVTRSAVIEAIKGSSRSSRASGAVVVNDQTQHGILMTEWPSLSGTRAIRSSSLRTRPFSTKDHWPESYCQPIDQITLVDRLREVRALVGFRRVSPDTSGTEVPVDLGQGLDWLPGIETFGEGVFIRISETFISEWESRVSSAFTKRSLALKEACTRWGREPAHVYASARFVALHTLAHGFLRRLAFDAGYSSSSIRERVYCSNGSSPAAGILLYTADGDSEGSLGGLVRQGHPDRFLGTLQRTLADLSWCSADPVCGEMEHQGVDGMNAAACHACALASETSCSFNNSLLDRRLVVGSTDGRLPGLLSTLSQEVS